MVDSRSFSGTGGRMGTLGVGTAPSPSSETARAAEQLAWEQRLNGSAKWVYWIAAFSVVNAGLVVSGANLRCIIGMRVTDAVAATAQRAGLAGVMAALVVDILVAALVGHSRSPVVWTRSLGF